MVESLHIDGICPGCRRKGRVGYACSRGACARDGSHFIPEGLVGRPEASDPLVGRMVGEFLLIERIVRGGIANAYRALQVPSLLEVEIALASLDRDEEIHRNLYRQALALGRLGHHPNITRLVSFATDEFLTYLAFESQAGSQTLEDLFQAHGERPVEVQAARMFLDPLAASLGALASLGLVHGEIRPDNVFVSAPVGHVAFIVLGGFVRIPPDETPEVYPTREQIWRAPEQLLRHETGATTDPYAVAAIAFRLLFGRDPFPSDDRERLFWTKQLPSWDPTSSLGANVPPAVRAFFRRALAMDADRRFTWEAFRRGLDEALVLLESRGEPMATGPEEASREVARGSGSARGGQPSENPAGWRQKRSPVRPTERIAEDEVVGPPVKTRREHYEEDEQVAAPPAREHSGSTMVMSADELTAAARARVPRMHRDESPKRR